MNSHDTGFVSDFVSFLCLSVFLTPEGLLHCGAKLLTSVTFSCPRPRTPQASLPSDGIRQGIPTCLFLEKALSVLSYSFGIFHSSLTSSLGKVGLWVLQMSLSWYSRSVSLLHLRWMAPLLANNVPHFHLSFLLTRNFVVKITQPLFRAQTESCYLRQVFYWRSSQKMHFSCF